jgi:phage baseplate assembly protein W
LGTDKHALVNEQNTEDEIIDAVIAVLKTPVGFRDDLPDFGIPDQVFQEQPLKVEDVHAALDQWEDRAAYRVLTDVNYREQLLARINVEVQSRADA